MRCEMATLIASCCWSRAGDLNRRKSTCLQDWLSHSVHGSPARARPPGPSGARTAHPSYDMVPSVYGSGRGSPTLLGVTPTYIRSPPHHPGCKSVLQFSMSSHTRVRTAFHACCFHLKRHSRNHRTAVACRRASPGHLRLTQCATILLYTCEDVWQRSWEPDAEWGNPDTHPQPVMQITHAAIFP